MITYVYETIPATPDEKPRYFEIEQSIIDPALSKHPQTGEAIRRVVIGGIGLLTKNAPKDSSSCECGPDGCC